MKPGRYGIENDHPLDRDPVAPQLARHSSVSLFDSLGDHGQIYVMLSFQLCQTERCLLN